MNVGNPSFLKRLLSQLLSSCAAVDGTYVFDLHGRWRYQPRPTLHPSTPEILHPAAERAGGASMPTAQILAMTRV